MNISNPDKTYRVAQWAAGRIGRSAMRAVIRHPAMELVALKVHSESKEGKDAGELCELEPIGVKATRKMADLLAAKPDCVLYMPEGYNIDEMCEILAAGVNIVTTRSEFFYADKMDPGNARRLQEACQQGGTSLHATGSSPGFSTQILPMALSALSRRIDCMTIDEFADIPASTTPEMITDIMGFGGPVPDAPLQNDFDHAASGFAQSMAAVAESWGLKIDEFTSVTEFAAASSAVEIPGGAVLEAGTMAGQRKTIAAKMNGKTVMQFRANWYCSKDLDQDWELRENGWRVAIEGDTPMVTNISYPNTTDSFANHMSGLTAHPAVNAIPYTCEAKPGVLTNIDLPPILPRLA